MKMRFVKALLIVVVASGCHLTTGADIQVGDRVRFVDRTRSDGTDLGIPLHPAVGDGTVSDRLASQSEGAVVALGGPDHQNWFEVEQGSTNGWVVTRYVAEILPQSVPAPDQPGTNITYVLGCWNLEHFHRGATRGFPEYTHGGPSYPERNASQIRELADVIARQLSASLLVLNEINGETTEDLDGDSITVSEELDDLVRVLPLGWTYVIANSGRSQRIAVLYDSTRVRLNEVAEFEVPPRRIEGKDIFDRDPFAVHATLLNQGQAMNDLIIIGVHLASGQDRERNHDAAMTELVRRLDQARAAGVLGGLSEQDVLILGDFNANAFAPPVERFFLEMDDPAGRWDVLAGDNYPATRLSGVPLAQADSQIDYVIASRAGNGRTGLAGQELAVTEGQVHTELIARQGGADNFRRDLSDHIPLTVTITLTPDTD